MKHKFLLLLAILPSFLFAQPTFSEFEIFHYLDQGKEYYNQGNYDASIREFNMLIKRAPNHLEAYEYRANAYFRTRRYREAISDYDRAIELSHRQSRNFGFETSRQSSVREIDIIEPEHQDIEYAMLYNNRGAAKYHLGQYDGAMADFEQAKNINPDLPTVQENASRTSQVANRYGNYDRYGASNSRYSNDQHNSNRNNNGYNNRYVTPRMTQQDQYNNRPRFESSKDDRNNWYKNDKDDQYFAINDQNDHRFQSNDNRRSWYDDFKNESPRSYSSNGRVSDYNRNIDGRNNTNNNDRYSTENRYSNGRIEDLGGRNNNRYSSSSSNNDQYTSYNNRNTNNAYNNYNNQDRNNSKYSTYNRQAPTNSSINRTLPKKQATVSDWWKNRRNSTANSSTKNPTNYRPHSRNERTDNSRERQSIFNKRSKTATYDKIEVRGQTARYVNIERIVLEERSTMVHFKLTNYEREPMRLFLERPNDDGAFFITDAETQREYRMIRAYGLNLRPYETLVDVGQTISFSIEFERLDDSSKRIHILEGDDETDTRWNFYDVRLK